MCQHTKHVPTPARCVSTCNHVSDVRGTKLRAKRGTGVQVTGWDLAEDEQIPKHHPHIAQPSSLFSSFNLRHLHHAWTRNIFQHPQHVSGVSNLWRVAGQAPRLRYVETRCGCWKHVAGNEKPLRYIYIYIYMKRWYRRVNLSSKYRYDKKNVYNAMRIVIELIIPRNWFWWKCLFLRNCEQWKCSLVFRVCFCL